MSKVMLAGIAVAVVGVGGAGIYMSGSFSGAGREGRNFLKNLVSELVEGLKEIQGVGCLVKMLGAKIDQSVDAGAGGNAGSFVFDKSDQASPKNKGCLTVGWMKNNYQDNKWDGTFSWVWAFANEAKAMVMTNSLTFPAGETGKFQLSGIAYLFDKKGDTWKAQHKQEIEDKKSLSNSDLDQYFPKLGTGIKDLTSENKSYWEFIGGSEDLNNIYAKTEESPSQSPSVSEFDASWTWTGSNSENDNEKLENWSDNLDWADKLYSGWGLKDKLSCFKGAWKLDGSINRTSKGKS